MEDGWSCPDLSESDQISTEDSDQGYAKVEFATPMQPSIPEVEVYTSNESYMSGYYKFTQVVLSYLVWKELIQVLILELNMMIMARLMGHAIDLSCMLIIRYGAI